MWSQSVNDAATWWSLPNTLRDCPGLADVWSSLSFGPVSSSTEMMIDEWVMSVMNRLDKEDRTRFACVLWAIWYARNALVFNNTVIGPTRTLELARVHADDYAVAKLLRLPRETRNNDERWKLPSTGRVKLNTDAACRPGLGTGIGGVLRDEGGVVKWVFAKEIPDSMSVEVAEIQAVRVGVLLALEKGERNVVFEMDSQVAYSALRRPKEDISYFGGIVAEILALSSHFQHCSFSWVRRSANKVAHELAQFAYSCDSSFCSSSVPKVIMYFVDADFPDP